MVRGNPSVIVGQWPEESPSAQDAIETTSPFVCRTVCVFVVAMVLYVLQAERNGSSCSTSVVDNKRDSVSNQLNRELTNRRFGGTMHVHVSLLVGSHAEVGNFPKVAELPPPPPPKKKKRRRRKKDDKKINLIKCRWLWQFHSWQLLISVCFALESGLLLTASRYD